MLEDLDAGSAPEASFPTPLRDPQHLFEHTVRGWNPAEDLWVFGYASLIWRPEFEAAEQRLARVHGYHRSLRMRSRINRGTPEVPGLVFTLLRGGSCMGMVYRVPRERGHEELKRLWQREMPTGVYDPRWLPCRTKQGPIKALGFTLSRSSPSYTGPIDDQRMLAILRDARGRYGTTLDYLLATAEGLRSIGVRDAEIERLAALARRHGLAR